MSQMKKKISNISCYKQFIRNARRELKNADVKIWMPKTRKINLGDNNYCGGYFDASDDGRNFAVATGKTINKWFQIFVHEYCHFEQWRDRREWWESQMVDGADPLDTVLEQFNPNSTAKKISKKKITECCLMSARLEYDCERRVLDKIKEHDLPVDPKKYAQAANSYVTYYYAMPELRSWCNGKAPYNVPEIMAAMPTHMDLTDKDYFALAKKVMQLYRDHCVHAKK